MLTREVREKGLCVELTVAKQWGPASVVYDVDGAAIFDHPVNDFNAFVVDSPVHGR